MIPTPEFCTTCGSRVVDGICRNCEQVHAVSMDRCIAEMSVTELRSMNTPDLRGLRMPYVVMNRSRERGQSLAVIMPYDMFIEWRATAEKAEKEALRAVGSVVA